METRTLTSLVTPGSAPFEQYNATRDNDRQGPWTDIYSLAATLYRGIAGNGPIDAVARADALLSGNPDPLQVRQREAASREATARRAAERREAEQRKAVEQAREAEIAAAQAAAEEKARAESQAQRSVRLAVFPHDSIRTCFYAVGPRLHDAAHGAAGASEKVQTVYSYYVRNADASVVGTGAALWQGSAAKKSPKVPAVQAAARRLGADAVLMSWYDCHSVHSRDEDTYRADVYLVDVRTGKVYTSVKGLLDTQKAVRAVLKSLYASRGL